MALIFQITFLIIFSSVLKEKVLAGRLDSRVSEEMDALLASEDVYYDGQHDIADMLPPGLTLKKAAFWSPHPSDYNPMRRPGTSSQTLPKRGNPYHPLPRTVVQQQKKLEDLENLLESLKEKRQSPGSYLLLKLSKPQPKTGGR